MKKTYISPDTLLDAFDMEYALLAGSVLGTSVKSENADPENDVLSRRDFNVWGDEDEEE